MTHRSVAARTVAAPPPGRLEPDAIGVAQDTVIGMASAAPAVCVALTLAPLAVVASYGGVTSIVITGIPMLIIANAYRRLNMWNANCGASFEWVGRSINPYLGFLTGWLMVAGYIIGAVAGVEVLGPSVLAVFTSKPGSAWTYVLIATAVALLMLLIAVVGIRVTARTQVGMAAVEYTILIGFAVVGLIFVLNHHAGTFPITSSWFNITGIGGHGSLAGGLLLSVFIFSGWEGTLYVNEETKHRRTNPGRAAIIAVILLTIIYAVAQLGLQGVVSPDKLQAHADSALVYVAKAIGGSGWSQVMALSLALSVIAATLTNIVLTSRIVYGMASYRALPGFLATVSRRFATPVSASIIVGILLIALTWIYLLANSVTDAFTAVVDVSGLLFGSFYILTAFATVVYYRRRVYTNAWDALILGILPVAAAGFLVWIIYKSVQSAPASQIWSLIGVVVIGVILMFGSRFVLRSPFFQIARESDAARKD
ncbi:MAG TPA: APC family permease [Streptosporangiaceae bacterium]|jgi:amino acid transporter|nr:APC family permease [Streptosporangiaceae bacterium]